MATCSRCGAEVLWARSSDNSRWLRPLEPKVEGLVPDVGEVVVDLVDGEWRAVPVPTVRLARFHECVGVKAPPVVQPPPYRTSPTVGYDVHGDRVPEPIKRLPPVPGAERVVREQEERRKAEYVRRHRQAEQQRRNAYWASVEGRLALDYSCPECHVGQDERCLSLQRDSVVWGRELVRPHRSRAAAARLGEQYAPFDPDEELGNKHRSQVARFLRESGLFASGEHSEDSA
jgi:hypothetical protein